MKIVIIDPNSTMIPHVGVMIDEALIAKKRGDAVTYITCGSCMDSCYSNPVKSKPFCKICVKNYKTNLDRYIDHNFSHKTLNDFSDLEIDRIMQDYDFKFNSLAELKIKEYKNIDVGYATLSSFISNTRNLNPELTDFSKEVLTKMLKTSVRVSALCEKILELEKPDKVLIFNGRMPESRPILRYFLSKNIPVDIKEVYPTNLTGSFKKVTFHSALPHSIDYFHKRINEEWDKDEERARKLGESFFQNRRNAQFSGDKIYTASQKLGLLPDNWDSSKRNIVIFNSSEDEFASIGAEWENKVFGSQLNGIKYIFSNIKKYPNAEVYLRVHPNLKKIKYKYHTELYSLDSHPRVHVIPASSEISTYALVDAADVVVSFGTSVGVEAAHSSSPVVLLGSSFYKGLDFCYEPNTKEDAERLIFVEDLSPKWSLNILKYGNYIMCDKGENFNSYNFNCVQLGIGKIRTPNVAMVDQAKSINTYLESFAMRIWRYFQRVYLKLRIKEQ